MELFLLLVLKIWVKILPHEIWNLINSFKKMWVQVFSRAFWNLLNFIYKIQGTYFLTWNIAFFNFIFHHLGVAISNWYMEFSVSHYLDLQQIYLHTIWNSLPFTHENLVRKFSQKYRFFVHLTYKKSVDFLTRHMNCI